MRARIGVNAKGKVCLELKTDNLTESELVDQFENQRVAGGGIWCTGVGIHCDTREQTITIVPAEARVTT